jgi:large subunit ribosomal protein L3
MTIGLIGRKRGMTRVFTEQGDSVPVTVIEVSPNRITQVTEVEAGEGLWELRLEGEEGTDLEAGAELNVEQFEAGQKVDVTGTSKGKGFAGAVKRHNFRMQDATHGNSLAHRAPGSIGQCQTPGRVFKGKKMAGHMGDERVTTQNLEVVQIDVERNLLLIKGAVPGANGGQVAVRPAVKMH